MAAYTLVTTRALSGSSTYVIDYADDDSIVADAPQMLGDVVISVAIARGAAPPALHWLGEWRLCDGERRWMSNAAAVPRARGKLQVVPRRLG
jgi:hypothetical protein